MTKTGPQKIPGASQSYFYGTGQYSGSDMEVNCGVVHTTEGRTLPSYNSGAMAPTVTGVPDIAAKKIRWFQHYDVDESARALANKLGGVQTNTANAFQIELVGTCDDTKKTVWGSAKAGVDYLHWPTAPDWALAEVAWLVRWLHDNHGIPLTCIRDWLAYGKDSRRPGIIPASYGASPARMTFAEWQAFKGWCGHQHVPENDHGDPGSMDFARVIQLAKGEPEPSAPQEGAVPSTLGLYDTDDRQLTPGKWTTLTVEKTDLLTGATAYDALVSLTVTGAAPGGTLQGRFYHLRADGSRWDSGIVERLTTPGSTFADFPHLGSIAAAEKLRFEVAYFPATEGDTTTVTVTTSRVRGLYWK